MLAYNKRALSQADTTALRCATVALTVAAAARSDVEAADTCKTTLADCLAKPAAPPQTECDDKSIQQFASCRGVTVGESNACLLEAHAQQQSWIKRDVCAAVTVAGAKQELVARAAKGTACEKLASACK